MGPRPSRRGDIHPQGARRRQVDASMGPRPSRRGDSLEPLQHAVAVKASMGPRPSRRGDPDGTPRSVYYPSLQWGHALPGVETGETVMPADFFGELQWGHALPGVETADPLAGHAGTGTASMGPRPSRRGDEVTDVPTPVHLPRLQWGHALPGVETRRALLRLTERRPLQWGHALPGVETDFGRRYIEDGHLASMGPRPSRRGDTHTGVAIGNGDT